MSENNNETNQIVNKMNKSECTKKQMKWIIEKKENEPTIHDLIDKINLHGWISIYFGMK